MLSTRRKSHLNLTADARRLLENRCTQKSVVNISSLCIIGLQVGVHTLKKFTVSPWFEHSTPQAFSKNTTRVFLTETPNFFFSPSCPKVFCCYLNLSPKACLKVVPLLCETLTTRHLFIWSTFHTYEIFAFVLNVHTGCYLVRTLSKIQNKYQS